LKNLISIEKLKIEEINSLLKSASELDLNFVSNELRHKKVLLAFFEPSTRTKLSFELAAKNLGAETLDFLPNLSSINKGETLIDSLLTVQSMGVNVAIVRHPEEGIAKKLSENLDMQIINAGDGMNQHPSQALLDALTLKEVFGELNDIKLTICGDILHSRVARSNIDLLSKLGVEISLCGPTKLIENRYSDMNRYENIDEAVKNSDVVMSLRIQHERMQESKVPIVNEYFEKFGFKDSHFEKNKNIFLMHPGPVNYGVEVEDKALHHPRCLINDQVKNGVLIRMAIIKKVLGYSEN
jgi:aspartate carbamoyltransferase catalytic subunit